MKGVPNFGFGLMDLKPWLVDVSPEAIAMYPIGALEVKRIVPLGRSWAELLRNPRGEMSVSPWCLKVDRSRERSRGVSHAIPD